MDEQKPPSEEKDAAAPADGAVASEEMGSAEGDPLKPPEEASAGPEPESADTKGPPQAGSTPARRCALCNCGDWSPHGQRELQRFEPAPDWAERLCLSLTPLPAGHCWVHRWCAAWSAGVGPEPPGPVAVARAVFSGISQKCEHCRRTGATIPCRAAGCPHLYHLPCAAAAGCFQSMKSLRLLCPEHVAEALQMEDARCSVCDGPGDLRDLVFCTSCGQHYHGGCLDIALTPRKRSGWQCPECKVCQTCRQPGEDSMMLVCEACDKGYHTFCMEPAIEGLPADSWKCRNCRVCSECGRRPAGLDAASRSSWVCESCQQRRAAEEPPARTLASPDRSEPTDVPVPPPEPEPAGCDEEAQLGGDPKETPPGDGRSPPGEPIPVEVPPSEVPPDELPLDKSPPLVQPPDVQPPEEPPPLMQPSEAPPRLVQPLPEEPPPLMLPPDEPPPDELLLERPSLDEPPLDKSPVEELPPSEPPLDELPPNKPPLENQLPPEEDPKPPGLLPEVAVAEEAPALALEVPPEEEMELEPEPLLPPETALPPPAPPEAPRLEREGTSGSSPPLSEEDALEEGRAGGTPKPRGPPCSWSRRSWVPRPPWRCALPGRSCWGGDTSSSFPGSEPLLGSPDPEGGGSLSLELGPPSADASLQKEDAGSLPLGAETDDSLLFEPVAKGDGDKSRRRSSPGRSRVKQGRSSSFPGRRRPRGGSHGGRGRGRARLKSTTSSVDTLALADVESSPSKEEDEDDDDTMQNTVVLFSNTDKFVLMQDMCVVCGSFGRGAEGHLLACSQCSQCYHPYCVNSKITKVMLLKGWRCVECIVCEGGWKCKWCVCCVQCGAASPGFHCEWQNNYTHCAPCASLVVCPFCREKYVEDDLLIQCRHCDRWLHAACDSLFTEEEVEQAADEGFDCSACQPYVVKPAVPAPPPEIASVKAKEPEPQYFRFEGVWLTETGMAVLRNLSLSPLHKRRQRKGRLGTLNGDGGLEGGDPLGPDDKKDGDLDADELLKAEVGVEHMECEIKLEAPASPDRDIGADVDSGKGLEDPEECKKRKRKPYRPGIGGFMVRQRKSHTRLKKVSAVLAEVGREGLSAEGHPEDGAPGDLPTGGWPGSGLGGGRREEEAPGKEEKQVGGYVPPLPAGGMDGGDGGGPGVGMEVALGCRGADGRSPSGRRRFREGADGPEPEGAAGSGRGRRAEGFPGPRGRRETGHPGRGCAELRPRQDPHGRAAQDGEQRRPAALQGRAGLGRARGAAPELCGHGDGGAGGAGQDPSRAQRPFLQGDLQLPGQGSVSLGSLSGTVSLESYSGVCQSPFLDNRERSGFFSPDHCEPESPWASSSAATTPSTPTTPTTEGEGDGLSYNQRSLQRWEKDEELGELSTISPVLYANMNFPNLKQDYPDWSSRCKQIMKLWRKVPATDKAPYLQKAKDNRAAHRINKVQKQAESQINKQTKGEGLRKPERPSLHLRIPPDASVAFLPRTALGPPADKREEAAAGLSAPPNRDLAELPGGQDGALGTMSQSELEKQRQRQRLRELLIRQQIQRNSLRQEKESAAAAATSSPAAWATEAGSQAFELSRGMAPYQPVQDKALLGTLATASGAGKLPGSVMVQAAFTQDERLSRPPPAATPAALDINGR
ncbi:unnamed protein product [Bubo scandiacus]